MTTPGREWQLTETGQKQAQIVGQHLREAEFPTAYPQLREEETTRFYCSPYVSPELDHAKGLPRGDLLHQ